MTQRSRQAARARGFTLTELLIAVAIVGVLSAVAFPLYTQYQLRSHRAQAFSDLGDCALALERFYTRDYTYAGAGDGGADTGPPAICPDQSPETGTARYDITIASADASEFTLQATAVGTQDGDGDLQLTSNGTRRWDKNDDGDFDDSGEDNWKE